MPPFWDGSCKTNIAFLHHWVQHWNLTFIKCVLLILLCNNNSTNISCVLWDTEIGLLAYMYFHCIYGCWIYCSRFKKAINEKNSAFCWPILKSHPRIHLISMHLRVSLYITTTFKRETDIAKRCQKLFQSCHSSPHVQNALPYKIRHGKQGEEGKMVIFDHYVGFHVHFPKWKGFLSSYYLFFPAGRVLNLCLFIAVS